MAAWFSKDGTLALFDQGKLPNSKREDILLPDGQPNAERAEYDKQSKTGYSTICPWLLCSVFSVPAKKGRH